MSLQRIYGVILRYFYFFARLDHMADLFFWPTLDLFIWGITSVWIQQSDPSMPTLAFSILAALVFWQLIWRSNYEISVNLLQEFWSRNLVNLFSTPLKLREWVCALMCIGIGKIFISLLFGALLLWALYALNIFTLGIYLLPFCAMLLISGWFMGFLSASLVIYFGQRVQMLSWMTAYIFMPFSAVFYPVSALPSWGQTIAYCLPMTYVFEGLRHVLHQGIFSWSYFWMSLSLNLVYCTFALCLFAYFFEKSRTKGLSRFE